MQRIDEICIAITVQRIDEICIAIAGREIGGALFMQRRMSVILVILTMTSLLTACQNRENLESGAEKETKIETETKIDMENESEVESEIEAEIKTESETGTGIEQANEQLQGQNGHTDKNEDGGRNSDQETQKSGTKEDNTVNPRTGISAEKMDSAIGKADQAQGEMTAIEKSDAEDGKTAPVQEGTSGKDTVLNAADSFYYTPLTEDIKARITGSSYPDTDEPLQISYEDLSYIHVLHYDFEGQVQEGELICNQAIAQDLVDIFYELYEGQYPIEKICLIDEYNADDEASMADNNTSCFNYRTVSGRTKLSNHSYGLAIDINPLYNPYVRTKDGRELISPDNAVPYADRSADFPHKIDKNDLCYRVFIEHGFTWGGAWNSSKDYQHFEKSL